MLLSGAKEGCVCSAVWCVYCTQGEPTLKYRDTGDHTHLFIDTIHKIKHTHTHNIQYIRSPSNFLDSTSLTLLKLRHVIGSVTSILPEDALCLSPAQSQNILGKLNLHPGQFPVWEELTLPLHHLIQRTAEQGGSDDGPPTVVDLLQGGLT